MNRNTINYVRIKPERHFGVSMTQPDRSMSISEIMVRFARGQPLGGRTDVYFDEDNEFDTERDYDLTELAELRQEHTENFNRLKQKHEEFRSSLEKENADKAYFERLKKEGYEKSIPKKEASDDR